MQVREAEERLMTRVRERKTVDVRDRDERPPM